MTMSEMNKRKIELADCLVKLMNKGIMGGDVIDEIRKEYNDILKEIEKRHKIRGKNITL